MPAITRAATLATGTRIVLATKGTVRLARGFTSITYTRPSLTANCTFISPRTPRARASASVWRVSSATTSSVSEWTGSEQALSPEWMPASSICSMMPATKAVVPSTMQSTSTSIAPER